MAQEFKKSAWDLQILPSIWDLDPSVVLEMEISLHFTPRSLCLSPAASPGPFSPSQSTVKRLFPFQFHQNFSAQGFGASFLPDSRGWSISSSNPTWDKLCHILWLCLSPPQHPTRGVPAPTCSRQLRVHPQLLIPSFLPPNLGDFFKAEEAAVDPGFSSIPAPFWAVLLQVQELLLSLPELWGCRAQGNQSPEVPVPLSMGALSRQKEP